MHASMMISTTEVKISFIPKQGVEDSLRLILLLVSFHIFLLTRNNILNLHSVI